MKPVKKSSQTTSGLNWELRVPASTNQTVGPPASICNDDMVHFCSMGVDNSISYQYMHLLFPKFFPVLTRISWFP